MTDDKSKPEQTSGEDAPPPPPAEEAGPAETPVPSNGEPSGRPDDSAEEVRSEDESIIALHFEGAEAQSDAPPSSDATASPAEPSRKEKQGDFESDMTAVETTTEEVDSHNRSGPASPDGARGGETMRTNPGLLAFLIFCALAVILIAYWWIAGRPRPVETAPSAISAPTSDPVSVEPSPDAPPSASAAPPAPESAPGAAETDRPETPPGPDKISNAPVADAKPLVAAAPVDPPGGTTGRDLPAAPASGGEDANADLRAAARAAILGDGEGVNDGEGLGEEESLSDDPDVLAQPDEVVSQIEQEAAPTSAPADVPASADSSANLDQQAFASQRPDEAAKQDAPDGSAALAAEIAALKETFERQVGRLTDELSNERSVAEAQAAEIAQLRASLEEALAMREGAAATEVASLREALNEARRAAAPVTRQALAALALNALQQKVISGAPFEEELDVFMGLAPNAPLGAQLSPLAPTGAPTVEALQQRFPQTARDVIAAARMAEATDPVARFLANFQSLVSVRSMTPQEGDSAAAVVSRAEAAVRAGEISSAITELSALEGPSAEAAAAWLNDARAMVEANTAIAEFNDALRSQFRN